MFRRSISFAISILGLKKIADCLEDKGLLIIESGMLVDRRLEDDDFLFCPVKQSPYEYSSCTFFNKASLATTLKTFGCKLLDHKTLNNQSESTVKNTMKRLKRAIVQPFSKTATIPVKRQIFFFQKEEMLLKEWQWLAGYWYETHNMHTIKES